MRRRRARRSSSPTTGATCRSRSCAWRAASPATAARPATWLKAARAVTASTAKGYRKEPDALAALPLPLIVFWNFNHFVVVEGFAQGQGLPERSRARAARRSRPQEFDEASPAWSWPSARPGLQRRAAQAPACSPRWRGAWPGSGGAVAYCVLVGAGRWSLPGLVVPVFARVFVDEVLVGGLRDWIVPAAARHGARRGCCAVADLAAAALSAAAGGQAGRRHVERASSGTCCGCRSSFSPSATPARSARGSASTTAWPSCSPGELANTVAQRCCSSLLRALMSSTTRSLTLVGVAIALLNLGPAATCSRGGVRRQPAPAPGPGKLIGDHDGRPADDRDLKATGAESDFFARWAGYQAKVLNAQQRARRAWRSRSPRCRRC